MEGEEARGGGVPRQLPLTPPVNGDARTLRFYPGLSSINAPRARVLELARGLEQAQ